MDYPYKSQPFQHQRAEFELSRDMKARALWWEMGCGKTKPTIDSVAWLFLTGKVRGLLVLAPRAVAPNWAADELAAHLPEEVAKHTRVLLWDTDKSKTEKYQREMEALLRHEGLAVVCMSYDGIMTETKPGAEKPGKYTGKLRRGRELAKDLLTTRPTMMVLDESARIKDPNSKRTKRVLAAGEYAAFRRALSGTPISNNPFDVYAQVKFLDPMFWRRRGADQFAAFKALYADWSKALIKPDQCPHPKELRPNCGCQTFPILTNYRNLPDLHNAVAEVGSRLLKEDVLDLPPKMYTRRTFSMTTAQRRTYDQLRTEFMVLLSNGDMITAPLVITQLLRLQQITSGYCPTDDGNLLLIDDNPRVDLLMDLLEDVPHKAIVWAKFQQDFAQIAERLRREGVEFVEYHGQTSTAAREEARRRFQQDPNVKLFLGNPQCAGEGLTLHAARTVIYYNTDYRLAARLQSEDRAHRIGQRFPVQYIDVVAERSADEKIIDALRAKKDLADLIMGDPRGNWI